jgi:hypothetical protein
MKKQRRRCKFFEAGGTAAPIDPLTAGFWTFEKNAFSFFKFILKSFSICAIIQYLSDGSRTVRQNTLQKGFFIYEENPDRSACGIVRSHDLCRMLRQQSELGQ